MNGYVQSAFPPEIGLLAGEIIPDPYESRALCIAFTPLPQQRCPFQGIPSEISQIGGFVVPALQSVAFRQIPPDYTAPEVKNRL